MTECELCGATENIDQHHISYEDDETVPLCRSCHQQVHGADEHRLKPVDAGDRTTIEISKKQKQFLDEIKDYDNETYREALEKLLDVSGDYGEKDGSELDEQRVRTITRETVNDMVLPKALE